eukprot:TRINITY_DN506_c0_g1_i1.p1 TRINITY_DN506_c0_g1~~TRINITY_DN506_c0_g1_i1.p1  ORF type:complete len:206 (-),score=-11.63 TRINITY_DN506_c0_g1_i1:1316-1933(-)
MGQNQLKKLSFQLKSLNHYPTSIHFPKFHKSYPNQIHNFHNFPKTKFIQLIFPSSREIKAIQTHSKSHLQKLIEQVTEALLALKQSKAMIAQLTFNFQNFSRQTECLAFNLFVFLLYFIRFPFLLCCLVILNTEIEALVQHSLKQKQFSYLLDPIIILYICCRKINLQICFFVIVCKRLNSIFSEFHSSLNSLGGILLNFLSCID